MPTRRVIVLGATGSIGRQTIECIEEANRKLPGRFAIVGLSAHKNGRELLAAGSRFPEARLALSAPDQPSSRGGLAAHNAAIDHKGFILYGGPGAVSSLIRDTEADLVVNGIAGAAGLMASVDSLASGKNLALANKESVVMGYSRLKALSEEKGLAIIPVDSEHAALFQLVSRIGRAGLKELTITASGGPFRDRLVSELGRISPDEAARHPVWKMGRKISIDSATLANKGLELIEAVRLFGFPEEKVKVLIHPESLVHALIRTRDGALYAQLSSPDMRLPISMALHWPEEVETSFGSLDLAGKSLHFSEPDSARFPMLRLARAAVRAGEAATIAYNAANEVAVETFEARKIRFTDIALLVEKTLSSDWAFPVPDLGSIFEFDARARTLADLAAMEFQC